MTPDPADHPPGARPAGARSIDEVLADARSRLDRLPPAEAAARVAAGAVLCSEGYTSGLAADSLRALGLTRSTDVVGGHRARVAAGLPTTGLPTTGGAILAGCRRTTPPPGPRTLGAGP